jgi:hypothetical protein
MPVPRIGVFAREGYQRCEQHTGSPACSDHCHSLQKCVQTVPARQPLNCLVSPSVSAYAVGPRPTILVSSPNMGVSVISLIASELGMHGGGALSHAVRKMIRTTSNQLSITRPACRALAAAIMNTGETSGVHARPQSVACHIRGNGAARVCLLAMYA